VRRVFFDEVDNGDTRAGLAQAFTCASTDPAATPGNEKTLIRQSLHSSHLALQNDTAQRFGVAKFLDDL
jgi:hypothetical protein